MNRNEFLRDFPYIENLEIIKCFTHGKEPERVITHPISLDWKNRLDHEWWSVGYKGSLTDNQKEYLNLRDVILEIGGEEVHMPNQEIHYSNLMKYGQSWSEVDKICECEQSEEFLLLNSKSESKHIWNSNRGNTLISQGYALSKDGMWRRFSWLIYLSPDENLIVDAEKHIAYFGYVLTYQQCNEFLYGYL